MPPRRPRPSGRGAPGPGVLSIPLTGSTRAWRSWGTAPPGAGADPTTTTGPALLPVAATKAKEASQTVLNGDKEHFWSHFPVFQPRRNLFTTQFVSL